jgi:hypothetical protein
MIDLLTRSHVMISSEDTPGWRNGRRDGLKIEKRPKNEISRDQMNQYLPTSQPSKFCLVRAGITNALHHLYIIGFFALYGLLLRRFLGFESP